MNGVLPSTFPAERLDRIAGTEQGHFWHAPRRELFLGLISRRISVASRILDAGCGTGTLVDALDRSGYLAQGIDPIQTELKSGDPRFTTGQLEALPFPDAGFAAVCAFDVLEHVDDVAAARELHRVLVPGGVLFVSVPAYAWLWSRRDELARHRRRYDRPMLRTLLVEAGFEVERLFGFQFLLLPLLALSRLRSRWSQTEETTEEDYPAPLANRLLRAVNHAEVLMGRWLRPSIGSSLVAVARKPGPSTP